MIYTNQVTAAGQLTVTLLDQIDHTFGDNVESNLAIDLGGSDRRLWTRTAMRWRRARGDIVLNIGDDIPQIIGHACDAAG